MGKVLSLHVNKETHTEGLMISIPVPFVVAILLAIILIAIIIVDRDKNYWLRCFILASTVVSCLVGLRWALDWKWLHFIHPVIASLLPALAWFTFIGPSKSLIGYHLLPTLMLLLAGLLADRSWFLSDGIIAVQFISYGCLLIWGLAKRPNALADIRLSEFSGARQAGYVAAGLLVFSGVIDCLIAFDSVVYSGDNLGLIVSLGNLISLPVLVLALLRLAVAQTEDDQTVDLSAQDIDQKESSISPENDHILYEQFNSAMLLKAYYRDPNLTLNRIARKLKVPARQLSGAINRVTGKNVSQIVHEFRIDAAKELLKTTNLSITDIMFDCGFQTKSNFNREFLRVVGVSPSDFRRSVT